MTYLYRRLSQAHARVEEAHLRAYGDDWRSAAERVNLDSLDFETVMGIEGVSPVANELLENARSEILKIREKAASGSQANRTFDNLLSSQIQELLPMSPFEAGDDGVWRYLAFRLVPDVLLWRWPLKGEASGTAGDRFHGMARERHGLGHLWWRHELLGDLSGSLLENEFIRLQESTYSVASRPAIAQALARISRRSDVQAAIPTSKDDFLNDMIKELASRGTLVPIDLLGPERQAEFVDSLVPSVLERHLLRKQKVESGD